MDCPKNLEIDHINCLKNDNRKSNLRICSHINNLHNRKSHNKNKNEIIGVNFVKKSKKWHASICVNGKNINLGYFDNKEETIKARLEADKKYYGEFSYNLKNIS